MMYSRTDVSYIFLWAFLTSIQLLWLLWIPFCMLWKCVFKTWPKFPR